MPVSPRMTTAESSRNATETFLLIAPSFFYVIVAVLVSSSSTLKRQPLSLLALLEFMIIVIPIILHVTVFSPYVTNVVIITCFILGMQLLLYLVYRCTKAKQNISPVREESDPYKKDYVTNIRATINLVSVIAIFAANFSIFPAKYLKTHKTGFSLMDVGPGLFMFANGIVAPELRDKKDHIKSSAKSSLKFLGLGILLVAITKLTHFKVSDEQHGIRWNFFLTLAVTKMFCSCMLSGIYAKYSLLYPLLITVVQEVLVQVSFKKLVFAVTTREPFFDANKESVCSLGGYIAIYMYSVSFANTIKTSEKNFIKSNLKFLFFTLLTFFMTILCYNTLEVSRRLANAGYIFWVLFIGMFMGWLFYSAENCERLLFQNKQKYFVCTPFLYEAINYNALLFFLLGNALTGLINLSMETKLVSTSYSLLLLIACMFINCGTVFILYLREWGLKC